MAELERQLATLKAEYANKLPAKYATIDAAFRSAQSHQWRHADLTELYQLLHRLAGSGKTFGFDAVTTFSRQAEHVVKAWLERATPPSRGEIDALGRELSELEGQCRPSGEPAT